ncbi:5'-methylthioadenosine/S-adenosylhomocysteine nucleosidase family protein [Aspergillus brunneoviolaceus CBS 621.78]|uniref:Purine and uridine phosphorylase n=1 Tax=Aspergillus brunneoviolaceus CBS 621.78 TaxID=1450534 RepID=A0ACD1FV62_9EURO|nr:purine and uridine phosphorylase [Aspergillus brunneoviolaceus CBS 621.78]RAH40815.1 purine and uridine phosphorylase [Aspergillus brunneoviolaceus CBS 621.78]
MYHHTYTVGLVSALPKELYAIRALFDSRYKDPPVHLDPNDTNSYVFGRVGHHDVVAACLPQGEYGTNSAADVASNMHRSFPALRFCLLVGIGGGVPSRTHDVRLGDVVVSQPTETHSGVVQYDLGKVMEGGSFQAVGVLTRPPRVLMKAISNLTSDPDLAPDFLQDFLHQIAARNPSYRSPGSENDSLHQSDALHSISSNDGLNGCACPLVDRPERNLDYPRIFYGVIASGNQVVKSSTVRDQLGSRHRILCLEMEAAGVMNTMPCLVIRGICDYADAHKNKAWQEYAAATAAAYAKVLLSYVRRLKPSSNNH